MVLDISTLTTYSDTASLLQIKKVSPIIRWEAAVNILDQWEVFLKVIFGPGSSYPVVYELTIMVDASEEVNSRLMEQARYQLLMPVSLVRIIQNEFNKSFRRFFTSALPVRWPHL